VQLPGHSIFLSASKLPVLNTSVSLHLQLWVLNLFFDLVASGLTMLVGICIPFFNGLLSFFGGFAFAPTTYFVSSQPYCIFMLLLLKKTLLFAAPLRHVAFHLQTEEVRLLLDSKLGM
jgi:hypothetical protein